MKNVGMHGRIWSCLLSALLLGAVLPVQGDDGRYDYRSIVGYGETEACYQDRDFAFRLARTDMRNNGNRDCMDLGDGWRFDRVEFDGYEDARRCNGNNGIVARVDKGVIVCRRRIQNR